MDSPAITAYYKEIEPMKRKKLLEKSIAENEDPEGNQVREELWNIRYSGKSKSPDVSRADGFMALLMDMELNKQNIKKLFGRGNARKNVVKRLESLRFAEFAAKDALHEEILYRECCHLLLTYIKLCMEDKTYGSALMGLVPMKKENIEAKLRSDIYETFIEYPFLADLEKELQLMTRAAKEMYALEYPDEPDFPNPADKVK